MQKEGRNAWDIIAYVLNVKYINMSTFPDHAVNNSDSSSCSFVSNEKMLKWVIPEKIHPPPPTDGTLEILAEGGLEGSGNPGRRGGLDLKFLLGGSFSP